MDIWLTLILIVHVVTALAIIGLVLLQHGKGADMGAAFGGGASGSLFGATGSANFLSRTTAILAAVFFLTSLALAYIATNRQKPASSVTDSVMDRGAVPVPSVPVPGDAGKQGAPAEDAAGKAGEAGTSKADEVPK